MGKAAYGVMNGPIPGPGQTVSVQLTLLVLDEIMQPDGTTVDVEATAIAAGKAVGQANGWTGVVFAMPFAQPTALEVTSTTAYDAVVVQIDPPTGDEQPPA